MGEQLYRTFEPDLEVRSAAKGGDGRTIVGIAVPYNKPQRINARLTEQFAQGAFRHQLRAAHRVPFTREHMTLGGQLIGRTVALREDTAGLYGEWRVSKTAAGEETLELVKDGALRELSIGFREHASGNRRLPGGIVERTKADLVEVAVVLQGAYGEDAAVAAVRSTEQGGACPECGRGGETNLRQAEQIIASLPVLSLPDHEEQQRASQLQATEEGRKLWRYWTKGEGRAKWASNPHPYTALVRSLREAGVPEHSVKGLAANMFHAVFGIWPGERKGDNPVGPG